MLLNGKLVPYSAIATTMEINSLQHSLSYWFNVNPPIGFRINKDDVCDDVIYKVPVHYMQAVPDVFKNLFISYVIINYVRYTVITYHDIAIYPSPLELRGLSKNDEELISIMTDLNIDYDFNTYLVL